jgi:outer membrane protein TolC
MMRGIVLLLLFFVYARSAAQDSIQVMRLRDYYELVLAHHPVVKQAANFSEMARAEIRTARGGFDPLLKSDYEEKKFDQKNYWTRWESKLIVPVWSGADIKIAYDDNNGRLLDNQYAVPEGGLSYVGVSVPLGQGLLIDQRRATLRQAQQLSRMAEAERVKTINKLLLSAAKTYWEWTFTRERLQLHQDALRLASERFEAIRSRVLFGDLPAIDSLEAYIEVQNRRNVLTQSDLESRNARLIASNFLWNTSGDPVELPPSVLPVFDAADLDTISREQQGLLLELARINHPELLKLDAKKNQLEIERRWAAEKLRPKLNFDYNFLQGGVTPWEGRPAEWQFNNNYKMGFVFSLPLFLREERGKLGLVKLKIEQLGFDQRQLQREILTEVNTSWNQLTLLDDQIRIQEEQVKNAALMLEGELFRFNNGESSIFLINTRENALINSKIKLVELKSKYAGSKAYLYWSAGTLNSDYGSVTGR